MKIEKREFNEKKYVEVTIARFDSVGRIMDIKDSISYSGGSGESDFKIIEKVKFTITEYAEGKDSKSATCYMDLDDFLYIANEVISKDKATDLNFTDYKGSKNEKFSTGYEAREFTIRYWDEYKNKTGGYTFQIKTGAGKVGDLGQVSMDKSQESTQKVVKMATSIQDFKKAMIMCRDYTLAKKTAFLIRQYNNIYPE